MYSICIIDDSIPAKKVESIDDTQRLNQSNLRLLLDTEWDEAEVKTLVEQLLQDATAWNTSAFIHPAFYLTSLTDEGYRPDVIIYDWDFAGVSDPSQKTLIEILNMTFSVVAIYSREDLRPQIEGVLDDDEIKIFKNRIFYIVKEDSDSSDKLLKHVVNLYDENFSFRFGRGVNVCNRKPTKYTYC